MANFYGTVQGGKGLASRIGNKISGMTVTCNGWNSGIRIEAYVDSNGIDTFKVYQTSGSTNSTSDKLLTMVNDERN